MPLKSLHLTTEKTEPRLILLTILLTMTVSRGLLEIILPKSLAMMVQFGILLSTTALLFFPKTVYFKIPQKTVLLFVLLFACEALISCFYTSYFFHSYYWPVYLTFNAGLLFIALATLRKFETQELNSHAMPILLFLGWVLILVSAIEFTHRIHMPGSSQFILVRPASITGSFLHYPIVMALIGFICIQYGKLRSSRLYFWSGALFCLTPFVSASRSGIFIVLFALMLFPFINRFKESGKIILFGLLIALSLFGFMIYAKNYDPDHKFFSLISRITTATQSKAAGNEGRIYVWKKSGREWLNSNLLIGERAGEVTNSTNNLVTGKVNVAESSVLQLLANFGLIGLILFYGILIQIYRLIPKEFPWLKAALLAAFGQTLFYQSIEVIPFMMLLMLLPYISETMEIDRARRPDPYRA